MSILSTTKSFFSLVKFSHTVFAMPFAAIGFTMALSANGFQLEPRILVLTLLCMVLARNTAMGFNRYIDRKYDAKNERTVKREIPAGVISPRAAVIFIIVNVIGFIVCTYFINTICFYLSPVALFAIMVYSLTKRFTSLCHYVVGVSLALAPIGAYLAVTGEFALLPVTLSCLVLLWSGGFDVIYALQDQSFDKENNLHSIPVLFGTKNSLIISAVSHVIVIALAVCIGIMADYNIIYWIGACLFTGFLVYQHLIVKPNDLSKVNIAFATMNGIGSIIYGLFSIVAICVG